jgi:hypothetical protein
MPQECTGDRDIPTKSNYFAFAWHFMGPSNEKQLFCFRMAFYGAFGHQEIN